MIPPVQCLRTERTDFIHDNCAQMFRDDCQAWWTMTLNKTKSEHMVGALHWKL